MNIDNIDDFEDYCTCADKLLLRDTADDINFDIGGVREADKKQEGKIQNTYNNVSNVEDDINQAIKNGLTLIDDINRNKILMKKQLERGHNIAMDRIKQIHTIIQTWLMSIVVMNHFDNILVIWFGHDIDLE